MPKRRRQPATAIYESNSMNNQMITRAPFRRYTDLVKVPNEFQTLEEAHRLRHWDLPELSTDELRRELRTLVSHIDRQLCPAPWFSERIQTIRDELRDRAADAGQEQERIRREDARSLSWQRPEPTSASRRFWK